VRHASPDHRCALLPRAARIDGQHQADYCLSEQFPRCPVNVQGGADMSRRLVGTSTVLFERRIPVMPGVGTMTRGGSLLVRESSRLAVPVLIGMAVLAALIILVILWNLAGIGGAGKNTPSHSGGFASLVAGSPGASGAMSASPRASSGRSPGTSPGPSPHATPRPSPHATPRPSPSHLSGKTYVVKNRDSLWSIAQASGTTVAVLRQINHLAADVVLRVGQVLKLP